jgi:hypothetical protein
MQRIKSILETQAPVSGRDKTVQNLSSHPEQIKIKTKQELMHQLTMMSYIKSEMEQQVRLLN